MIAAFRNIRFVYNAVAQRRHPDYVCLVALWNQVVRICVRCDGRLASPLRDRSLVVSMDRLLRYFLSQFIRRGAMTFTTASGAKFTCGDGTGEPVSVRFMTADAERRILLDPELGLGEVFMDGTFIVENGSIADALAILLDPPEM
jgi:hypothetical protein